MDQITIKRRLAGLFFSFLVMQVTWGQSMLTGFQSPPDSIQTSVYWYWISGNISREGVVKDLEAMKRAGINRAFIGNVGIGGTPDGKVRLFSPEWWDILHAALQTATRLHIDIGMFNSPGWSGAGGPWVRPDQAMRYLVSSETVAHGPGVFHAVLPEPADSFQDVRVIAYPAPRQYEGNILSLHPAVVAVPTLSAADSLSCLLDGNENTEMRLPEQHGGDTLAIRLAVGSPYTVRSLVLLPGRRSMRIEGVVEVEESGVFRKIGEIDLDRSNDALNVGFNPYGALAVSLPATSGRVFRVVFYHWTKGSGIREMKLSASPVVGNYIEKTLGKMHPTPHPFWSAYQWPVQPEAGDTGLVIDAGKVVDISSYMDKQGVLRWNVPAGDWVILRTGMTPTRVVNSPAPPEGTGLQGDKMSKERVAENFDAFVGEVLRRIPEEDRRSFKVVVEDSYEVGGQNWTDGMIDAFKRRHGYDPTPYIPVMMGHVVGSEDKSDRFLWDLRRFIADKVAYDYVGGLWEASHRHGLTTWLENYGHWGFPGEFLQYGGQSDEVGGEFWAEGDLGDIENRCASSSAHIYGKNKVSAESFTAGGGAYARYPALLKPRGDRFFTEGINNTLLHVFISQPDDRMPGINAWFGTEFNRHNTWFDQLDVFTIYLKRCNFMLRQGRYVADVAYFIGEDAPKMTGVRDPELPKGYSYDFINAEVIEKRLFIKDRRWTLPNGLSYKVLVLPKLKTMRPELLRRLDELVQQGGVLLGPPPERSPSLEDYGEADEEVRTLAGLLWGDMDGKENNWRVVGKGIVAYGMDLQALLNKRGVGPDCRISGSDSVLFLHRTTGAEDIYFISNQSGRRVVVDAAFRVRGKAPELWDPLLGKVRKLAAYTQEGEVTRVPLQLERYGSCFVVFRAGAGGDMAETTKGAGGDVTANFPAPTVVVEVRGPWTVRFDKASRGPVTPVVFDALTDWAMCRDTAIKYYSGKAVYKNTFRLAETVAPLYLDLGMVRVMAKVKVNGVYVGGVWTSPYVVDISAAVKKGVNVVEVEVVNTWVNRLIGDSRLPEGERRTWMNVNPYNPGSALAPSGLLGPVRVVRAL